MIEQSSKVPIERGNMKGQHFTQWRIDLLQELLNLVVYAYGSHPFVAVENARVWYDAAEDFHRLEYTASGKKIEVQFYKVFSSKIDGRDGWRGCVRSDIVEFARHLREESR